MAMYAACVTLYVFCVGWLVRSFAGIPGSVRADYAWPTKSRKDALKPVGSNRATTGGNLTSACL
jgi:hypothetical protein